MKRHRVSGGRGTSAADRAAHLKLSYELRFRVTSSGVPRRRAGGRASKCVRGAPCELRRMSARTGITDGDERAAGDECILADADAGRRVCAPAQRGQRDDGSQPAASGAWLGGDRRGIIGGRDRRALALATRAQQRAATVGRRDPHFRQLRAANRQFAIKWAGTRNYRGRSFTQAASLVIEANKL